MRRTSCVPATSASRRDVGVRVGERGMSSDENVEIVVVVAFFGVVMRGPGGEIVLGGGLEAEQHCRDRRALAASRRS